MRIQSLFTSLVVAITLVGCNSEPLPTNEATPAQIAEHSEELVEISIIDSDDEVTNGPWDNLFDLTLLSSPRSFSPDDIVVLAAFGSMAPLKFKLNDLNANRLLDPGESLSCIEPAVDTFGTWVIGEDVSVGLQELSAGKLHGISAATWTADN
jgi:hypothetical protein